MQLTVRGDDHAQDGVAEIGNHTVTQRGHANRAGITDHGQEQQVGPTGAQLVERDRDQGREQHMGRVKDLEEGYFV